MNSLYHLICLWILFGVCFLFEIPHAKPKRSDSLELSPDPEPVITWDPNFDQFRNPNNDCITIRIPMAWSDINDAWVPYMAGSIEITSISYNIMDALNIMDAVNDAEIAGVFHAATDLMTELRNEFSTMSGKVNEQEYATAYQSAASKVGMDTLTIPNSETVLRPDWYQIDFNRNNPTANQPWWQIAYTGGALQPVFPLTYDRIYEYMPEPSIQRQSAAHIISSGVQVLWRHWFIIIAFCCVGLSMIAIYLVGFGFRQCRQRKIRIDRRRVMMRRQKALESHPHVVPVATMV